MFIKIKNTYLNRDEIRALKITEAYKKQYYIDKYYKAILITKSGAEYELYEHENKALVERFIENLISLIDSKIADIDTLSLTAEVLAYNE